MAVADIGCGMGYFTLPMAGMVGAKGKVIAADLQIQMLKGLASKTKKQRKLEQIELICCSERSLNLNEWENKLDFILTFAVAHEVPDRERMFKEIAEAMKSGAKFLLVEPQGHVSEECFNESVRLARTCGLKVIKEPKINMSRAVLLEKA